MSGANYDILAKGLVDKALTANPQTTFWKSTYLRHTSFACEHISQPFNTQVAFGQEAQILLNRAGDLLSKVYLRVELPGIVACDASDALCAGIAQSTPFPVAECVPCEPEDEAALFSYLPSNYSSLKGTAKTDALTTAKNSYRRSQYGAGTELGCCVEDDSDCPTTACPELGDTWGHYVNAVGHALIKTATLKIGGQQIDKKSGLFMHCWEEMTGKPGKSLTEMVGRRYTRSQLVCDSRNARTLYVPLPFWFTKDPTQALPLASMQFHAININVVFESLE
jgi:hypothetical protein